MLLPYPVIDSLTPDQVRDWDAHFSPESGGQRRPALEEGIWEAHRGPGQP